MNYEAKSKIRNTHVQVTVIFLSNKTNSNEI